MTLTETEKQLLQIFSKIQCLPSEEKRKNLRSKRKRKRKNLRSKRKRKK